MIALTAELFSAHHSGLSSPLQKCVASKDEEHARRSHGLWFIELDDLRQDPASGRPVMFEDVVDLRHLVGDVVAPNAEAALRVDARYPGSH